MNVKTKEIKITAEVTGDKAVDRSLCADRPETGKGPRDDSKNEGGKAGQKE